MTVGHETPLGLFCGVIQDGAGGLDADGSRDGIKVRSQPTNVPTTFHVSLDSALDVSRIFSCTKGEALIDPYTTNHNDSIAALLQDDEDDREDKDDEDQDDEDKDKED